MLMAVLSAFFLSNLLLTFCAIVRNIKHTLLLLWFPFKFFFLILDSGTSAPRQSCLLLIVLLHWYFITSRLFIPFPAIVFYKSSFRVVLIYISGMASKGVIDS